jgi:hypothetical protein
MTPRLCTLVALLLWGAGCAGGSPEQGVDAPVVCALDTLCDDGDLTTAEDRCDGDGVCVGTPIVCPTGPCIASAAPNGVDCDVSAHPDGVVCDDQSVCTAGDQCQAGECLAGQPLICDDGDPCTEDACDSVTGCAAAWVGGEGCVYNCIIGSDVLGHTGDHELAYAMDVVVEGKVAFIGTAKGIELYDVQVPGNPKHLAQVVLPGAVLALEVHDEVAYVSIRAGGVVTIDVSDPTDPQPLGAISPPGNVRGIYLSGTTAYLADDDLGLLIYDVVAPTAPTLIGFLDAPGWALDVHLSGDIAYVANRVGLLVVDVTEPTHPQEVTFYDTPGYARAVHVDGLKVQMTYLTGVSSIDVLAPTEPELWSQLSTPGIACEFIVEDGIGYLADYNAGFAVLDAQVEPVMEVLGTLDTPGSSVHFDLDDKTVYLADLHAGLRIIDVSDPTTPVEIASIDDRGYGRSVQVRGDLAYVANGFSGLRVIDISEASDPTPLARLDSPTAGTWGVDVVGTKAYLARGEGGLAVADLTTPEEPLELGAVSLAGDAQDVQVIGPIAYVAAGEEGGLRIVDVSVSESPVELGALEDIGTANALHVLDGIAYVAAGEAGLHVIDVSDAGAPEPLGSVETAGDARDVHVVGERAYVVDGEGHFYIVDVSQPTQPNVLNSRKTPQAAQGVTVVGDIAYVACTKTGIIAFDVSDPAIIRTVLVAETPGEAVDIAMRGTQAYVADGSRALSVVALYPPCPGVDSACGATRCDAAWGCVSQAGQALCDDGVACTVDVCDAELGCVHTPGVGDCDDGIACTIDTCSPAGGCGHAPRSDLCDDQNACTVDECQAGQGCVYAEVDCDDGLFCTGPETCDATAGCQSHTPPVLEDGDACTVDTCDEQGEAVTHVAEADICNDSDACTIDACDSDTGCVYEPVDCEDGEPCTLGTCSPAIGCTQDLTPCDDGLFCNGVEACDGAGGCVAGAPPALDDGVPCTLDVCQEGSEQVAHVSQAWECDDGDACTTDMCDPVQGCVHAPIDCDNAQLCDGLESCDPSVGCVDGQAPLLSDGVPCTIDACDEATDTITHTTNDAECDDANHCTADQCNANSGCSNPWVGGFGCGHNCNVASSRLGGTPPHGRSIIDEVVAVGDRVYAATSAGLEIYGVSDPAHPHAQGWLMMRSRALDVVGHTAYVGTSDGALRIVDVTLADKPAQVGALGGFGAVHAVRVVGDLAHLATDVGLALVDVTSSKSPTLHSTLPFDDVARDVEVAGFLAHVAVSTAGIVSVDISDPEAPLMVAKGALPGVAHQLLLAHGLAYVTALEGGLHIVDLAPLDALEPADPSDEGLEVEGAALIDLELLSTSHEAQGAVGIALLDDRLYVTRASEASLVVSDLATPDSPTPLESVSLTPGALEEGVGHHVTVVGSLAYVAAGKAGLHVLDLSAPSAIEVLAVFDDRGQAQGVRLSGQGLAFVADGPGGFRVVDASDTSAPVEIWREAYDEVPTRGVDVVDDRVFVVTSDTLSVRSADPATEFEVLAHAPLTEGYAVDVVDDVAYVADGAGGLRIFDVSDEAVANGSTLVELAGVLIDDARAVHVLRGIAHVADGAAGLRMIDVQLPSEPMILATLELSDVVNGIQVLGPIAYVTGEHEGLHIVDVSEPDGPAFVSTLGLSGAIRGAHVVGTNANVTVGTGGLAFVNVSDLGAPEGASKVTLQPYDNTLAYGAEPIGEVRRDGHLGFVASGALLLTTLSIEPPCDDGDLCTADICDSVFGCSHPPDTHLCYDGDPCTQDLCSGDGVCDHPVDPGAPCDDDDATTLGDACNASGVCVGTPYTCVPTACQSSSVPNGATCDVALKAEGTLCNDADLTTHFDSCNGLGDCGGIPYTCAPLECEATATQNGEGCDVTYFDHTEGCDDGASATHTDVCDGQGGCAGTPYVCVPSQCEETSSTNGVGCDKTYQNALHPCDDGALTTQDDTCNGIGTCAGVPYECTPSQCEATATPNGVNCDVTHHTVTLGCDDGNPGTQGDHCDGAGGCLGTPYACAPTQCQLSSTPNGQGCDVVMAEPGLGCDDADASTRDDLCDGLGGCAGTPYSCLPGPCEASAVPNGVDCDVTYGGTTLLCDDEDVNTKDDLCDGAGGCAGAPYACAPSPCEASSAPNGVDCDVVYHGPTVVCDDGDTSTKGDACDGVGGCSGTPYACTASQCDLSATPNGVDCDVVPLGVGELCDDGVVTTRSDMCDGLGGCEGTAYACETATCVTASTHNGDTCDLTFAPEGSGCIVGVAGTCDGAGACVPDNLCPPQTLSFSVVGSVHEVSVPGCANAVTLEVWGAQGGFVGDTSDAGKGGYARGTMLGVAGQALYVRVGGAGGHALSQALGGFNGGGGHAAASSAFTVGGGGASDVRLGAEDFSGRIIVAGGGGASAWCNGAVAHGGHGGGAIAASGGHSAGFVGAQGAGGMVTAGGAGGAGAAASSGVLALGGDALNTTEGCDGAGAGGGGYYGGGGGSHGGGGGGGSSWVESTMIDIEIQAGVQSGDGLVVISW